MRPDRLFRFLATLALLALPAMAPAANLEGTVVDSAGAPVAGATVWVTQQRQVRTAQSDGSGRFSLGNIDVAVTEVVAYKEGFALGGATALVVGDATVEVRLAPGDLITIKVLDTASRPVPGTAVRAMTVSGAFLVSVEDLVPHGLPPMRSDDNGILTVAPLPQDGHVRLVLSHPRYADATVRYLPVDREQRNILLQEGRRVGGRVTYGGRGVAGARVSIFKAGAQGQKEFAEILSDADGHFYANVHPGHYGVAVQHRDFASPTPVPLEVPLEGEAPSIGLALETPRFIRGRVLYPDERPCGGARVVYRKGNTVFQDTLTNNDGAYTLTVPGGPGELAIGPPRGYQNPHLGTIPVDMGEVKSVDLSPVVLKALPVISGVIRDQDGGEPGPVLVTIQNLPVPYSTLTDGAGKLSLPLDFMPDVETLRLQTEHGRRFQRRDIEIDLKNAEPFDVKLETFTPDLAPRDPLPGRNNLSALAGKPAPELRGTEWLNSEPLQLAKLKGKVVVLLFWAGFDEDMGPVVLREIMTLYRLLEDVEDVAFVGIHDAISSADEIRDYIDGYGIPFPVLRDENEQTTFSTYNIVFIPQIVLLDKQGNVRYYQTDDRLLTCIKGLRRE